MFIERIFDLGLLQHDPNTDILKFFPLNAIINIVKEVAEFLSTPGLNFTEVLSTDAHVYWAMECIGKGFSLPIEHEKIMHMCIDIYIKWLEKETRPASMNNDSRRFLSVNKNKKYQISNIKNI